MRSAHVEQLITHKRQIQEIKFISEAGTQELNLLGYPNHFTRYCSYVSASTAFFQNLLHFVNVIGFDRFLQFFFVKRPFQFFAVVVFQFVHGRIARNLFAHGKNLFSEVGQVSFFKRTFDFTDSHLIPNIEFIFYVFRLVAIIVQRVPYLLFVIDSDVWGFLLNAAMNGVVVRVH